MAKKTTIFAAVFAFTCIIMGGRYNSVQGEEHLLASILASIKAGQATIAGGEMPAAEQEAFFQMRMDFPFSGEYPSLHTDPLPIQPLIETVMPTPDGFTYTADIPLSKELQKYTYSACVQKNLEYELVLALMWRESRFQIDAINVNTNGTKDSGIMQINDVNRGWLKEEHGIVDLMDPYQNIEAGTTMLSNFVRQYGVHDALMAYQYGEQGMQQKFSEGVVTNEQIAILIQQRDQYRTLLQST